MEINRLHSGKLITKNPRRRFKLVIRFKIRHILISIRICVIIYGVLKESSFKGSYKKN